MASLEVLIVGKKKNIQLNSMKEFSFASEFRRQTQRHPDIYPTMTKRSGTWGLLYDSDSFFKDADKFVDINWGAKGESISYPFWLTDERTKYMVLPITIVPKYMSEFQQIILELLNESSKQTIMFLPRIQGTYEEIICGTLKPDKFFTLLKEGKILTNICYIISKFDVFDDEYIYDSLNLQMMRAPYEDDE